MQIRLRSRLFLAILVSLVITGMIWSLVPNTTSQAAKSGEGNEQPTYENFDIRYDKSEERDGLVNRLRSMADTEAKISLREKRETNMRDAESKLRTKIPNLQVSYNDKLGSPEIVGVQGGRGFLTAPAKGSREASARQFISSNAELYGLSPDDMKQFGLRADATNPDGNLSFVFLERKINGLPVFRSEITAAFTRSGELFRTVGEITPRLNAGELDTEPGMDARQAVSAAASKIGMDVDASTLKLKEADGNRYVFDRGPFADDVTVELMYFPMEPGSAALSWSVMLWQDSPAYMILVGADGGELLFRKNITNDQTQPATYVVYNSDSPAPLSPSNSIPGAPVQAAAVPRTSFSLISELANTDPWLADGATTTTGNNVDAGLDLVSPNGIEPATRAVSATRNFDFAYDPAPGLIAPGESPTLPNYRFGEVVNMFFWANRYHDRLYQVGFTEPFRNFQTDNYGRGGLGNDFIRAEGQDFSGTSNANFSTPADGSLPRMQMYIFDGPNPDRTSGLDQEILIHEMTHGTSNRLHSNAAGLATLPAGGMGEGWGDFYARVLLSDASENVNGIYAMGGWSTQLIVSGFQDNYYYGIRRFPHTPISNLGANGKPHSPQTLADIDATQIDLSNGAFPRGPIGSATASQVHNVGEIWCAALLEVRARIITRTGWAAGNQRMLQLTTDAMKIDPASPTLVDGRNSILAASAASGGTEDEQKDIWAGFAARGIGFGATMTNPSSGNISVSESFLLPNLTLGTVTLADEDCPDENNAADPGETIQLAVQINNTLLATDATGTTAEIVGGGSANYGTIAANSSGTQNISYTVPADAECGSVITLTININSSIGPVSYTYDLHIGMPTGTGPSNNYSSGNIAVPINDNATVDIPINVTGTGRVGDVNVKVRLNHTFDGDVSLRLVAPDGSSVPLATSRGSSGDNYGTGANDCSGTSTIFDDSATNAISAGTAPFNGSFRPESPLSALRGKAMNGTWNLRVSDNASLDTGTVGCVQVDISEQFYYCCGVDGDPVINAAPPAVMVAESVSPANGAPDPEEVVTMSFPLTNVGSGFTTDLVATLVPGGGITPLSGPQSYGAFSPADGAVARDFTFVAQGSCGSNVTATFSLSDDGVDLGTVTFTIRLGATQVGGGSFSNTTSIAVPAPPSTGASTGAPASPYPSAINVAGIVGSVTKVTATVTGLSHTFPSDIDMVLVGPGGQSVMLMSDVGGGTDAVNANITFDDSAPAGIGATVVSGTFRPTNSGSGDVFPAPAPAGIPSAATLSAFNGVNPNGAWNLFIVDDAGTDTGSISGGWSLTITTADPVCNSSACTLTVANMKVPNDPGQPGAIVDFPIVVNGSASIGVSGSCGIVSASPASGSFFTVGTTAVNVVATRADASTTNASFNVEVNDVEAPVISNASVTPNVLWPPNHRLRRVSVDYTVTDNYSTQANITTSLKVQSNEPINGTGDGDTAPDWQVMGPHSAYLRAERAGGGTGRIYTITITATDEFGNQSTKDVYVYVPHNQRFDPPTSTEPGDLIPAPLGSSSETPVVAPRLPALRNVIVTRSKKEDNEDGDKPVKDN